MTKPLPSGNLLAVFCGFVLLGILFSPFIALWLLFRAPDVDTPLARVPSPDGAWTAQIDEVDHSNGIGGDSIIAGVTLMPTDNPRRATYVLSTDTGGNDDERPRVLWTAPNVLQVTVYARSYLKLLTRQVGPVHIDLRFDPPDPAARAGFLHEMHMDPQPGE